jgi:membrane fusion protein (multidrug efflux system)
MANFAVEMRIHLLLVPFLLLVACSGDSKKPAASPPPVPVDVIVASNSTLSASIECNGTVLAAEMVELHPETSGRIIQLTMGDGASVKKGQLLVKINDAELQAQKRQQQVQLELARKNKSRFEKLLAVNGINQTDYDNAVSQVATLEAALDITTALIEKTEVRAPFNGVLGLRMVSPGAYVTTQTVLGMLKEEGTSRVDFTIPEQYSDRLKKGAPIQILTFGGDSIKATISAVEPQANALTRNFKARSLVNNSKLISGGYVKVILDNPVLGILVPTPCIIPDALSSKVMIVSEGKGKFVNVKTGIRTKDVVQITDGIAEGDSVIVTGVLFVRPNAPVTVHAVKEIQSMLN